MSDFARLILLLVLAGSALTALGGVAIWFMEEERRIRRAFHKVLGAKPEAVAISMGRGRAAGFCFSRGVMATAWDSGDWCLVYRIDEMMGAELLVDGEVVGRAYRGEPRMPLDQINPDAGQVVLRLVFDDPANADFDLELYRDGDEARRGGVTAAEAVQEANRWLARTEAILRRPPATRRAAAVVAANEPRSTKAGAPAAPAGQTLQPDNDEDDEAQEAAPL